MQIQVFGRLIDVTRVELLQLDAVADTDELIKKLTTTYPALQQMKFMIAVNKKQISANTALDNNSIIALMPPFSGG